MPIYEFRCERCGARFEALTAPTGVPPCPNCGAVDAKRLFSPISRPLKLGLRGAAARRSDALRRVREERRLQERAERRDQRAQQEGRGDRPGREQRGRGRQPPKRPRDPFG